MVNPVLIKLLHNTSLVVIILDNSQDRTTDITIIITKEDINSPLDIVQGFLTLIIWDHSSREPGMREDSLNCSLKRSNSSLSPLI